MRRWRVLPLLCWWLLPWAAALGGGWHFAPTFSLGFDLGWPAGSSSYTYVWHFSDGRRFTSVGVRAGPPSNRRKVFHVNVPW